MHTTGRRLSRVPSPPERGAYPSTPVLARKTNPVFNFKMARAAAVQQEYARQVAKASKENKKTADAVADSVTVGVGLIQRQGSEDSKSS